MAEKKQEFQYGSAFLPDGEKKYSVIRWGWNGLNRTDEIDTGQLSDMSGLICDPPYMTPVKQAKPWIDFTDGIPIFLNPNEDTYWVSTARRMEGIPISIYGFDNQLCMAWEFFEPTLSTYITVVDKFAKSPSDTAFCSHRCGVDSTSKADEPRTIIQFNVVDMQEDEHGQPSGNIVEYTYDRKILLYPDCYSMPYVFALTFNSASSFNLPSIPASQFAAVYGSRVFGATDNAVFASAYNSYADYSLDTADDVSSAHAWWSMAQSNTEANGNVTAVCTYGNHVVIFRKDFMHLVYNNKNPFRVVDVGAYGCDSNKAWTILNGVLYFASQDKVYAFTGGTPKEISRKLESGDLSGAVLGSYRNSVWMQTKNRLYIYKDGAWSDITFGVFGGRQYKVIQFATLDYGLVALVDKNPNSTNKTYALYYMDWDTDMLDFEPSDPSEWEPEYPSVWWFETELMMLGKLDVRRVKKVSVLCEGKEGASVSVYLLKDGESMKPAIKNDRKIGTLEFDRDGYGMLRVLTRQFSSEMHKLRFEGRGFVKFHAAELKIAWGGDLYVES